MQVEFVVCYYLTFYHASPPIVDRKPYDARGHVVKTKFFFLGK